MSSVHSPYVFFSDNTLVTSDCKQGADEFSKSQNDTCNQVKPLSKQNENITEDAMTQESTELLQDKCEGILFTTHSDTQS